MGVSEEFKRWLLKICLRGKIDSTKSSSSLNQKPNLIKSRVNSSSKFKLTMNKN